MSDIYKPLGSNPTNVQKTVAANGGDCVVSGFIAVDLAAWVEPDYSNRFDPYCPCGSGNSSGGDATVNLSGISLSSGQEEWSHHLDLSGSETWTSADIPSGKEITSLAYAVVVGNSGNSVVDFDGTTLFNLPTGYSAQFGPANPLNAPQSISAGAGRIIVAFTVKDV